MIRYLVYAIALSQFAGGVYTLAYLNTVFARTPFAHYGDGAKFWLAAMIAIYLIGIAGALLLFAGKRLGFTLSILHQLVLIPVVVLSAQTAAPTDTSDAPDRSGGFHYALGDAASVISVAYAKSTSFTRRTIRYDDGRTETYNNRSTQLAFESASAWITQSILAKLETQPGSNYYGVNILALISIFLLRAARRRQARLVAKASALGAGVSSQ